MKPKVFVGTIVQTDKAMAVSDNVCVCVCVCVFTPPLPWDGGTA